MSELKKYKLGDLGFFFGGVTSIKPEDYGFGTPFLPYKNVYKNSKVNVNELELMNVRPLDLDRRSAIYGDIFFTASSETPDEVAMSSVLLDNVENLTFNGFCKRFRLNNFNTLLPEYARYLFRDVSFRREVYQLATGDIRFNISQESLANIEIEIPDIQTQKEIAEILTTLDDKIELNLQMNQTLEAMAQAIFKDWFINFNFQDFDGELVNGLPKRWKYKTIGELGKVITGTTPSSKNPELFGSEIPFVTPTDFKNFGKLILDASRYLSLEGKQSMKTRLLPSNSVIVTCIGSDMGKVAINRIECVTNQQINSIIPNRKLISSDYLYYDLVYKYDYLRNIATGGSTMLIINKSRFEEIEILVPNEDILLNFQNLMDNFNNRIEENVRQINSLTQTRDTLLPKLMSGKIEVIL
ncbi:MAG: restriction endonuclease subunit S [Bacteroidales bacterium]|nr:restriction endonuclease subunit S [Bacteroidales bacterium]